MAFSQPDRYISLLTDFGFKRVFGSEPNKRLLIDFLNTLLPDYHQIRDVTFKNLEDLGGTILDRKAIFDVYGEAENGDRFNTARLSLFPAFRQRYIKGFRLLYFLNRAVLRPLYCGTPESQAKLFQRP